MTLLVEDGTGVAGAESYLGVTAFRAYWTNRGVDLASYSDATCEAKLREACQGA